MHEQSAEDFFKLLKAIEKLSLRELELAIIYAQHKLEYERKKLLAEKP